MKRFLQSVATVLWEKWVEFKFEWGRITAAAVVGPLLYMAALGWGFGASGTGGRPYIDFLVPAILALTTMNASYTAISQSLSIQRIFEHSFDQLVISPTPIPAFLCGQMLAGALRGLYGGALILLLSIPFGASMHITPAFFLVMLLNGLAFAAFGALAALLARTHSDVTRVSSFTIMPMTFLCNTFFPLERVPAAVKTLVRILPLTHASGALRAIAYGEAPAFADLAILALYALAFLLAADLVMEKKQNL